MSSVKITATYEPDDVERDSDDRTGLTEEAFEQLHHALIAAGLEDITIEAEK